MLVAHRPPASPAPLRTLSAMHLLPSVLRRPTALLAFAALWLGTQLHLFAQPATGAIAGRVLNPASGAYLGGARLTLEGTALLTIAAVSHTLHPGDALLVEPGESHELTIPTSSPITVLVASWLPTPTPIQHGR